jgi:hypothetical protein
LLFKNERIVSTCVTCCSGFAIPNFGELRICNPEELSLCLQTLKESGGSLIRTGGQILSKETTLLPFTRLDNNLITRLLTNRSQIQTYAVWDIAVRDLLFGIYNPELWSGRIFNPPSPTTLLQPRLKADYKSAALPSRITNPEEVHFKEKKFRSCDPNQQ